MSSPALPTSSDARGVSVERYLRLVAEEVIAPDDRVELLEGVVVAMAPSGPRHAAMVNQVADVVRAAVGNRGVVRVQSSFTVGTSSMLEPDVLVVPGTHRDYVDAHPTAAWLAVEVADYSLPQDRISKARIYARAGVPDYWIVNLRTGEVEAHRSPDPATATYDERHVARSGETLALSAVADVQVAVADLFWRE